MTDLTKKVSKTELVHESCFAYEFPHRLYSGDCCGCEDAPHCPHWEPVISADESRHWDRLTYERKPKK